MSRNFFIVLLSAGLAGCATDPIATQNTATVPIDRILSSDYSQPRAGTGMIVVKRDSGYLGSACRLRLHVDAHPLAELLPAERVELHIPAGDHIISVDPNGRCGGGLAEVTAGVKAGTTTAYRIGYDNVGEFHISATAF